MKVLFVNTSDTYGGAARAAMRIACSVKKYGCDFIFFVKNKQTTDAAVIPLSDFIPHKGLDKALDWLASKIKNKVEHAVWKPYVKTKTNFYLSDDRSTRLFGALNKIGYDILHVHWINMRFLNLKDLLKVQTPIIWTLHDSWPFCGVCHYFLDCSKYKTHCGACPMLGSTRTKDLAYNIFERKKRVYNKLNLHIVTPSKWLADCVGKSELFNRFPVTVIPNPLDTSVFLPRTREYFREVLGFQIDEQKKYLLYGANNALKDKVKGYYELQQSLLKLQKIYDCSNIELLIFGADQDYIPNDSTIPAHNLGYIDNNDFLSAAYSAADILLVPSLSEVFGQTASESLACGTPVVCFKHTGIQEIVDHKINGYTATDIDDFANGIAWVLDNNNDGHLNVNAREKAVRSYSMDVVGKQYADLYNSVLSGK